MNTAQFYDDIARYYDLLFDNWEASMLRQGRAIDGLIRREFGIHGSASPVRVLDISAGIGTQALPLAQQGTM